MVSAKIEEWRDMNWQKDNGNEWKQCFRPQRQGNEAGLGKMTEKCSMEKLSTMLYKEFTNIESTIGSDIDKINGNTGFSFINFSSILIPPLIYEHKDVYL